MALLFEVQSRRSEYHHLVRTGNCTYCFGCALPFNEASPGTIKCRNNARLWNVLDFGPRRALLGVRGIVGVNHTFYKELRFPDPRLRGRAMAYALEWKMSKEDSSKQEQNEQRISKK
jgi:hypothetical protein